jgi:hypothetical protein
MDAFIRDVEEQASFWLEYDRQGRELRKAAESSPVAAAAGALLVTLQELDRLGRSLGERLSIDDFTLLALENGFTISPGAIDTKVYYFLLRDLVTFQAYARILEYARREDATAPGLCENFLQERGGFAARQAGVIHVLQEEGVRNNRSDLVPDTLLAEMLTALVAARTGLSGERWDRRGLRDRLSEAGNRPKKELISLLPAELLPLFHEFGTTNEGSRKLDPELKHLTNEAQRRVRRQGAGKDAVGEERLRPWDGHSGTVPAVEDPELEAAFASEYLQELKSKAGLSGQQWESFEAAVRLGSNTEAAKELGRSSEQVGKEKYDAIKKLRRAAGS